MDSLSTLVTLTKIMTRQEMLVIIHSIKIVMTCLIITQISSCYLPLMADL